MSAAARVSIALCDERTGAEYCRLDLLSDVVRRIRRVAKARKRSPEEELLTAIEEELGVEHTPGTGKTRLRIPAWPKRARRTQSPTMDDHPEVVD